MGGRGSRSAAVCVSGWYVPCQCSSALKACVHVPSPVFSWCNDQTLLCGIRISPSLLLLPLPLPPPPTPAPSLTLALWLTGISLVQYVCQWGLRLSCAPAYPWCLSPSHTHTRRLSWRWTVSLASIMIWCPVLLSLLSNGSVIFVLHNKRAILFNILISPCSACFLLPPFLFCQVEIKMKKTDAIRWEKLEGEGQESNIKHFDPSQSTASAFTLLPPTILLSLLSSLCLLFFLHLFVFLSLSSKINISSCVCLFGTKMRVGRQALLDSFISLTAKVGRERERYDSKIWVSFFSPHIPITDRINYLCKCVCGRGSRTSVGSQTILSTLPALSVGLLLHSNVTWHVILWDHTALCLYLAWICLQCVWCCIYVNLCLDYISRSPSPSLGGIIASVQPPKYRNQITMWSFRICGKMSKINSDLRHLGERRW